MNMKNTDSPRLRTVDKVKPPYPLNVFPEKFGLCLGREIIYLHATKNNISLEGEEWEKIFADCIGAVWKPSNVGLDDVILDTCAWSAKTVKSSSKPTQQKSVRLISGRNSPIYSFEENFRTDSDPNQLGNQILAIWNERVSAIRKLYKHARTVVLIKSEKLDEVVVFEFDTIRYEPDLFYWEWNKKRNLEGFDNKSKNHVFTWQPHGSQFTIIKEVPPQKLIIKIRIPDKLDKETVLKSVGFNDSWITILHNNDG